MSPTNWRYGHRHLGEAPLPDGRPIRRPVVTIEVAGHPQVLLAVVDSGSPISVADATLFARLGVNLATDVPAFTVPLGLGAGFGRIPVYDVELLLAPPTGSPGPTIAWRLLLGARDRWTLPFTVLFGQRGWFDQFSTTIDADTTTVLIDS